MNAISLKRNIGTRFVAKEITLQETQGIKSFLTTLAMTVVVALLSTYIVSTQVKLRVLTSENKKLTQEVRNLNRDISLASIDHEANIADYKSTITDRNKQLNDVNKIVKDLDKQIIQLKEDNITLAKEYDELESHYNILSEREELFDRYDYIVKYAGKRTGITYDQIKLGEELMLEKGYDPHILFTIFMVETKAEPHLVNSRSNATGLGQFIPSTGKFAYESLLGKGKGTYTHTMAKNPETNIRMAVAYLDYLFQRNNNDLFRVVRNYCGGGDAFTSKYISWMRSHHSVSKVKI